MLQDTIAKIEGRIKNAAALNDDNREELLKLLGHLKNEISGLPQTCQEQAESITSLAEASTREATRQTKNPEVLQHTIGGLQSSVTEFESSHPALAEVVNRFASLLSNMGI